MKTTNCKLTKRAYISVGLLASALIALGGCVSNQVQTDLTNVNKDWDKTIRASHIYPIYPLTEDLQPGDVFWVSQTINDNSQWDQTNYLTLDRLIARIPITNYNTFYSNAFDFAGQNLPKTFIDSANWSNAPGAAFPSYGFTVQQGGGANVSLPIQGIPVGLALMGAKSASGQVAITEAHTYGIDEVELKDSVRAFLTNHIEYLKGLLEDEGKGTNYLQVVTRVFAAQRVAVSLFKDSGYGITLSGGAPKDVPIPTLTTNAAENYSNIVNAVNGVVASNETAFAAAAGLAPGGTLKFTSINSTSVSLDQQFPRPLVIGYLGFDVEITKSFLDKISQGGTNWTLPYAKHADVLRYQHFK